MNPQQSITTLLYLLDQTLLDASRCAKEAYEAAQSDNQNLAIGTVSPIARQLEDATALLRVILSVHSQRDKPFSPFAS